MKKVFTIVISLLIAAMFMLKAWVHEIDEYQTKEIDLVKAAGKNICTSCIGLSDVNILDHLKEIFKPGENDKN